MNGGVDYWSSRSYMCREVDGVYIIGVDDSFVLHCAAGMWNCGVGRWKQCIYIVCLFNRRVPPR